MRQIKITAKEGHLSARLAARFRISQTLEKINILSSLKIYYSVSIPPGEVLETGMFCRHTKFPAEIVAGSPAYTAFLTIFTANKL